jgi:transcription termination/antitermination protein NusG
MVMPEEALPSGPASTPAPLELSAPEAPLPPGPVHVPLEDKPRPIAPALSPAAEDVGARPEQAPVVLLAAEPPPGAPEAPLEPVAPEPEPPKTNNKRWYVIKVQSGREESIREAIERRVKKEGLDEFYGQIVIPVEKITEVKVDKAGKRVMKTKERKLYPGYLMAEVEFNEDILYLFRETSGVGDFVGGQVSKDGKNRPPTPMTEQEVVKMLGRAPDPSGKDVPPPPPPRLGVGDRVRVTEGTFNDMEGEVKEIMEQVGKVKVELTIFGRPVKVELEYFQIEQA